MSDRISNLKSTCRNLNFASSSASTKQFFWGVIEEEYCRQPFSWSVLVSQQATWTCSNLRGWRYQQFHQFFVSKVTAVCTCHGLRPIASLLIDSDHRCHLRLPTCHSSVGCLIKAVRQTFCWHLSWSAWWTSVHHFSVNCSTVRSRRPPFQLLSSQPILKNPNMNSADVQSYWAILNLLVSAELLERTVHRRMLGFLKLHDLLPRLRSAYMRHHSTETAVLKVLFDILYTVDDGELSAVAFLGLSAAFDTVDHGILLQRLETSFGVYCFRLSG